MRRDLNSISRTERWFFRCLLGPCMNLLSLRPAVWTRRLRGERAQLVRLWRRITQDGAHCERRQIRRLPGLEGISCDWSAAMVMEHLYLVGSDVEAVLQALTTGRGTPPTISVARVKPTRNECEAFTRCLQHLDAFICWAEGFSAVQSVRRWPHPWFGPLSAQGWLRFYYFHLYLHRRQLEQIASGSKKASRYNPYGRFRSL